MSYVVCTLFEGHYHYGVAALVNSLHKNGFKGDVYAGYRGELPEWAKSASCSALKKWPGSTTLTLTSELKIHFLPLEIQYHFTNYKPGFVIDLYKQLNQGLSGIFYFDPDIVVKCRWVFFEQWLTVGIPLVHEITNNDMPASHPVRSIWKTIIQSNGLQIKNNIHSYLNAGFWGIKKQDIEFAYLYKKFIEISITQFGADIQNLAFDRDRTHPFFAKDQDAMNLAAMCTNFPVSEFGPEAMDLIHGGCIMSHAIGGTKPWKKSYISSFCQGKPPSMADRQYWNHVSGVINPYSQIFLKFKKFELALSSFMGRFYRKS